MGLHPIDREWPGSGIIALASETQTATTPENGNAYGSNPVCRFISLSLPCLKRCGARAMLRLANSPNATGLGDGLRTSDRITVLVVGVPMSGNDTGPPTVQGQVR